MEALGRSLRRRRILKSGDIATMGELAESQGIADSYTAQALRLTLLAQNILIIIFARQQGWN